MLSVLTRLDSHQLVLEEAGEVRRLLAEDLELGVDSGLLQLKALDLAVELGDLLVELGNPARTGIAMSREDLLLRLEGRRDVGIFGPGCEFRGEGKGVLLAGFGDKPCLLDQGILELGLDHAKRGGDGGVVEADEELAGRRRYPRCARGSL